MDSHFEFYPSEIDRLILGRMKEIRAYSSFQVFLAESPNLREHYAHIMNGRQHSMTVNGKSLSQILSHYCRLTSGNLISCNQIASDPEECDQEMNTLEKVPSSHVNDMNSEQSSPKVFTPDSPGVIAVQHKSVQTEISTCDEGTQVSRLLQDQCVGNHFDASADTNPILSGTFNVLKGCAKRKSKGSLSPVSEFLQKSGVYRYPTKDLLHILVCIERFLCQKTLVKKLEDIINKAGELGPRTTRSRKDAFETQKMSFVLKACEADKELFKDLTDLCLSKESLIKDFYYKGATKRSMNKTCVENSEVKDAIDIQKESNVTISWNDHAMNSVNQFATAATLHDLTVTGLVNSVDGSTITTLVNSASVNVLPLQNNFGLYQPPNPLAPYSNLQQVILPCANHSASYQHPGFFILTNGNSALQPTVQVVENDADNAQTVENDPLANSSQTISEEKQQSMCSVSKNVKKGKKGIKSKKVIRKSSTFERILKCVKKERSLGCKPKNDGDACEENCEPSSEPNTLISNTSELENGNKEIFQSSKTGVDSDNECLNFQHSNLETEPVQLSSPLKFTDKEKKENADPSCLSTQTEVTEKQSEAGKTISISMTDIVLAAMEFASIKEPKNVVADAIDNENANLFSDWDGSEFLVQPVIRQENSCSTKFNAECRVESTTTTLDEKSFYFDNALKSIVGTEVNDFDVACRGDVQGESNSGDWYVSDPKNQRSNTNKIVVKKNPSSKDCEQKENKLKDAKKDSKISKKKVVSLKEPSKGVSVEADAIENIKDSSKSNDDKIDAFSSNDKMHLSNKVSAPKKVPEIDLENQRSNTNEVVVKNNPSSKDCQPKENKLKDAKKDSKIKKKKVVSLKKPSKGVSVEANATENIKDSSKSNDDKIDAFSSNDKMDLSNKVSAPEKGPENQRSNTNEIVVKKNPSSNDCQQKEMTYSKISKKKGVSLEKKKPSNGVSVHVDVTEKIKDSSKSNDDKIDAYSSNDKMDLSNKVSAPKKTKLFKKPKENKSALVKASNVSSSNKLEYLEQKSQPKSLGAKLPISETVENAIQVYSTEDATSCISSPDDTATKLNGYKMEADNDYEFDVNLSKEVIDNGTDGEMKNILLVIDRLSTEEIERAMYPSTKPCVCEPTSEKVSGVCESSKADLNCNLNFALGSSISLSNEVHSLDKTVVIENPDSYKDAQSLTDNCDASPLENHKKTLLLKEKSVIDAKVTNKIKTAQKCNKKSTTKGKSKDFVNIGQIKEILDDLWMKTMEEEPMGERSKSKENNLRKFEDSKKKKGSKGTKEMKVKNQSKNPIIKKKKILEDAKPKNKRLLKQYLDSKKEYSPMVAEAKVENESDDLCQSSSQQVICNSSKHKANHPKNKESNMVKSFDDSKKKVPIKENKERRPNSQSDKPVIKKKKLFRNDVLKIKTLSRQSPDSKMECSSVEEEIENKSMDQIKISSEKSIGYPTKHKASPLGLPPPKKLRKHICVATPPSYKHQAALRRSLSKRTEYHAPSEDKVAGSKSTLDSVKPFEEDGYKLPETHDSTSLPSRLESLNKSSLYYESYHTLPLDSFSRRFNSFDSAFEFPEGPTSKSNDYQKKNVLSLNKPFGNLNYGSRTYPTKNWSSCSSSTIPHSPRDEIPLTLGKPLGLGNSRIIPGPMYEFGLLPNNINAVTVVVQTQNKLITSIKPSYIQADDKALNLVLFDKNYSNPSEVREQVNGPNLPIDCPWIINGTPCKSSEPTMNKSNIYTEKEMNCDVSSELPVPIKEELIDVMSDGSVDLVSEEENEDICQDKNENLVETNGEDSNNCLLPDATCHSSQKSLLVESHNCPGLSSINSLRNIESDGKSIGSPDSIATNPETHVETVNKASENGKHVEETLNSRSENGSVVSLRPGAEKADVSQSPKNEVSKATKLTAEDLKTLEMHLGEALKKSPSYAHPAPSSVASSEHRHKIEIKKIIDFVQANSIEEILAEINNGGFT